MINIVEKLDRQAEKQIKQWPHPNNRASECGHPCVRFLVLSRLYIEKKLLHDLRLQRIFNEGRLHEKDVIRQMEEVGFEIVEQQRPFEWKKFQLTGSIDGKVRNGKKLIPFDIKSSSQNSFLSIQNLEPMDLLKSKHTWIRKYPAQIQLYMAMDGTDKGIIVFKNKQTGETAQKNFTLDYDYVETILKKLEKVNQFVAKGTIPECVAIDECRGCGFCSTMCFPGQDYGPGYEFYDDADLIEKLDRSTEIKPIRDEWESLNKELKKGKESLFYGKNAVVGNYIIESREVERLGVKYFKTTIKKLKE